MNFVIFILESKEYCRPIFSVSESRINAIFFGPDILFSALLVPYLLDWGWLFLCLITIPANFVAETKARKA